MSGLKQKGMSSTRVVKESLGERSGKALVIDCTVSHSVICTLWKFNFTNRSRYRSGDLGYYTGSGDVQCSGRDDDQAKIRGFRIELGEIDTHISHHPNVRENVTLVRRDKDEEPTLVSYIVPATKALQETASPDGREDDTMTGMLKRFRSLRDDVRENLRKKLPPYAVPSVIIPLQKFRQFAFFYALGTVY